MPGHRQTTYLSLTGVGGDAVVQTHDVFRAAYCSRRAPCAESNDSRSPGNAKVEAARRSAQTGCSVATPGKAIIVEAALERPERKAPASQTGRQSLPTAFFVR